MTTEEISSELVHACYNFQDLELVKFLMASPDLVNQPSLDKIGEAFNWACYYGSFEIIEYMLEKNKLDINDNQGYPFVIACEKNYFDIVRFLVNIPAFKLKDYIDQGFIAACAHQNMEIVEYLLLSPQLKIHANIQAEDNAALVNACNDGYLDVVQFLLTSSRLTKHANILSGLTSACKSDSSLPVLQYLYQDFSIKEALLNHPVGYLKDISSFNSNIETFNFLMNTPEIQRGMDKQDYEELFKHSTINQRTDIIESLVFTHEFEVSNDLKEWLHDRRKRQGFKAIIRVIQKKDLLNNLIETLPLKNEQKRLKM